MIRSLIVITLLLAPAAGLDRATPVTKGEVDAVLLGRDLEQVGLTVGAASLIRAGKSEQALRLLDQQLALALSAAKGRVDAGTRLPRDGYRSLHDAPRRARDYARTTHRNDLAAQADAVMQKVGE